MTLDSSIIGGLLGAGAVLAIGSVPFLVGYGRLQGEIDALKGRVQALEAATDAIIGIREDVAFIKGRLFGEAAQ